MTFHEFLSTAGGILAMLMFVPLFMRILRESGGGQSFASWMLWGVLDAILVVSLIEQRGNFWFVAGFAIGDLAIAALLAYQRRFTWGWFENLILAMVAICVIGWKMAGSQAAMIFSIIAVCVAGVPGFISLKRKPDRHTSLIWLGFSAANAIAFFGGTSMTMEQRLAPAVFTFASLLMARAGWTSAGKLNQLSN
jgi:hypothetical protein